MGKRNFKQGRKAANKRDHRDFPEYEGRAQMTRDGFIYVIVDGLDDDVFVPASQTRGALDGDKVRVVVTREKKPSARGKASSSAHNLEGKVIQVVERSGKQFIGVLHFVGAQAWVLMQSRNMPYDIEVDAEKARQMGGEAGFKVAAVVDRWDRGDSAPRGHIVDVLGAPGENDTEMHAILAEFNLPYKFEQEVEDAADKISEKIGAKELKGRKDFRDTFTFTIDPADAKDFDDALSFKPLSNGNFEVGVHIADVSYYVHQGSAVDKEARSRGTSVYLVDRTVPMLPEKLCNKLCSLRAGEDKLTFSTVFELTPDAKVVNTWIGRTVINSNYRLDYNQAQQIITEGSAEGPAEGSGGQAAPENCATLGNIRGRGPSGGVCEADVLGDSLPSGTAQLRTAILTLNKMAGILKGRRFKAGAIDFDRPEMKVIVDASGKPIDVYQKYSMEANWLIEEFMLLANRTVAEYVAMRNKTFVYRIHAEPNPEKLAGLKGFASSFGYKMGDISTDKKAAKALTELLVSAKGKPEFNAFENLALRAMAKAVYSTENIGHYGLAFGYYTHFTSPIRRYPDLMVHRLLADYLDGGKSQNKEYFEEECKHASERECIAADAERTSVKYKVVEFMQDKVGQEYEGQVSGLTEWGMYVEIDPSKIEGMVPLRTIRSDFFEFDEKRYRIFGRRTRKVFKLGARVRVRVKSANLEQRLLDFELVEPDEIRGYNNASDKHC